MNPRAKTHERQMNEVWESWDWHFYDKLQQLDHMTRCITSEFRLHGIPPDMWRPFLQDRLMDGITRCAEVEKHA